MKQIILYSIFIFLFNSQLYAKPSTPMTDYIVIGAGTAGSVVTNLLSKRNHVTVIHNGKNEINNNLIALTENAFVTVPIALVGSPFYQIGSTVPQANLAGRMLEWALAVPLGGASAINGSGYCRGTTQNYEQWAPLNGPDWSAPHITQIYKYLENYHGQTPNPNYRGYNGPIDIYQVPSPTQVSQKFNTALINATGAPFVVDYNDPLTPIGNSSQMQFTARGNNGQFRVSGGSAFLNRNIIDANGNGVFGHRIKIYFESTALRILFSNNRAIGVQYYHKGHVKNVYARKGIVISAGLKSSALLLHSGIGDSNLLNSLKIPVVYNNPNVGKNLIDNVFIVLGFTSDPNDTPININSSVITPLNTVLAMLAQTGIHSNIFSSLNVPPTVSQISDDNGIFKQISFLPDPAGPANIRQLLFSAINPFPGITFALFYLVQPTSRGSITINSNNPLDPPVIDYGMLNAADLALYIRGFQTYILNLSAQLDAYPGYSLFWPDPAIIADDDLLTEFILENAINSMHFQGHCRMAPLNQGGVVDPKGRVYGVTNLYVADNSVVPFPMDGTPMATAYLVGENIARMILRSEIPN